MNKIYTAIILMLFSTALFAQNNQQTGVITASEFHVTRPIREIFAEHPVDENSMTKHEEEESEDRTHRKPQKFRFSIKDGPQYGNDEQTMQRDMGTVDPLPLKANWAGQSASGFRPFDPSGAVGPNHYVQMINSTTFKVYNKTTGAVILTGTLGNLWSPATGNAGDPIVMYDKAADRWFLAQFGSSSDKKIYIAVSQTADPTGAYYTYTYVSPLFPDYLKFSVWTDAYYMTSNQSTQKVFAFNRSEILAGTVGARSVYTTFSPPSSGFFCPLPGDAADGTLPPAGTPCPIMSYSDNAWGTGIIDGVNMYNMTVNWVPTTPTATITTLAAVPTASFDASYNASWNDCDQPGTTQKLDGIGGVCMYRAQWKSWSGYNTVILNWGVKLGTTQRGIKWCELRQDQTTGVWSLYQEGIYNPDASTRWMGSIAMDNNGSIGLSYIKSDATSIYPGLYYTGRRSCDPLGTLPVTEALVVAGTGSQTGVNRVGDYSQTTLDMDGITFWSTSEYMGGATGSSAAATRIFSYQIPPCGNVASVNIAITAGTNPQCSGSSITFTATPVNGGTTPVYQWKVNGVNAGTNSPTFTSSTLANGNIVTCVMTSNLAGVTGSPATSNAITMTVNAFTTPAISIAQTSGSNPTCPGLDLTFTATASNVGSTPTYQWKVDGVNAGTNSSTFTTSTITNGQVVSCVVTSSALCNTVSTATSNSITMNVSSGLTPGVSIAQTAGSNPFCAGSSVTFTATPVNAISPAYQWKVDGVNAGTNSATFTSTALTNGQVVTCQLSSTGTCPTIVTLGTSTTTNATNSVTGVAYPTQYGNGRQQYLIRASELTALGLTAGNITSMAFNVAGTTGNPSTLNGYTIRIGHTTSTVMTAAFLAPTFTTVYGPSNYTPTLNGWNTHTFMTPFNWDGTSNIVVNTCFANSVTGTTSYQTYQSSSAFVSTVYYRANGATGAGACTATTTNGTGSVRPNVRLIKAATTVTTNSNSLTMNVTPAVTPSVSIAITGGTNPSCTGSSVTFTATPGNGGTSPVYQWKVNGVNAGTNSATFTTSTLTNGQAVTCVLTSNATCANPLTATSNAITMTINPILIPTVSIAITNGSNPSCAGSQVTLTASASNGGTPSYQWKVNGVNAGTNSATFSTSSLTNTQTVTCVMTSTATCANPSTATSNGITMTINSLPVVTASNVNGCLGFPVNLSGSPAGGTFSVANPYTGPGTSYTYSYTNSNGCSATSNTASITMNSASSNTPQTISACNTYTWPVNGITYITSGVKTASFTNVAGCDSTRTLNLTIKLNSSSSSTITATNSYTWPANSVTYTLTGLYTHTLVNSVGCDSILTLNLTINAPLGIVIAPKVLLAGAYNSALGLMTDSLRVNGMIPLTEPYSAPPLNYAQISYTGGETTTPAILAISGPNAIVDWVFLEIRSSSNPASIIATKRALVQRDGDVVSYTDGVSPVSFPNQFAGNYYVSIKHRNHLGVMTANAIALSSTSTIIDFSNSNPVWTNPVIANAPRKVEGSLRLLYCGDANANKTVKYNGASNDKDAVLSVVGNATPNNTVYGYRTEDVNLDSKIKYNNSDNDRGVILNSVGANTPNIILFQHTPN